MTTDHDYITDLANALNDCGAHVTFDLGRDNTNPCTRCGAPARPTHRLVTIGTYSNGDALTRPVCVSCEPIYEAREKAKPRAVTGATRQYVDDMRSGSALRLLKDDQGDWWIDLGDAFGSTVRVCASGGARNAGKIAKALEMLWLAMEPESEMKNGR